MMAAILLTGVHADAQTVEVTAVDPGHGTRLGLDQGLHARLTYTSRVPLRFQARGYAGGTERTDGERMNPAPVYPAGDGEAIVWVAYTAPTTIDELRVLVFDADWQPLSTIPLSVEARWDAGVGGGHRAAGWVASLNAAQQHMTTAAMQQTPASPLWVLFPLALALSFPGYLILQVRALLRWGGSWRTLALLPLVAVGVALAHAILALAAGSNIWPIVFIFTVPLAFLMLASLAAVRRVRATSGRRAPASPR
jgi:hypothetical protein